MIWEQHFWLDHSSRIDELIDRHGVGLVAWQKCNVDIFQPSHFRDILGICGNVDPQAIERLDKAIVPSFRVKLQMSFCGIVCRNGLYRDIIL